MKNRIHGRLMGLENQTASIQNETGTHRIELKSSNSISVGDVIEVINGIPQVLTPNRSHSVQWIHRILDPRRLHGTSVRSQVESGIREFFLRQNFRETRTPLLVPCPGMETHIRPFRVDSYSTDSNALDSQEKRSHFLPTSPEFAMKRLLVGGLEKIFQICSSFRDEPNSPHHRPEFTMLEWYRAYSGYESIMEDTENLFEFLALKFNGKPSLTFQGQEISVKTPWPRLSIRHLYLELVQVDLVKCSQRDQLATECKRLSLPVNSEDSWDDLYFKIWLNCIEPRLPANQAAFVTRYPASQAALSVIEQDPDGTLWAKRFELYAGGMELGNAFEELTQPAEQRKRFVEDMNIRESIYGADFPKNPLDEEFLAALEEGMPPSGGIAVGVDRMVMLFANEADIEFTRWL